MTNTNVPVVIFRDSSTDLGQEMCILSQAQWALELKEVALHKQYKWAPPLSAAVPMLSALYRLYFQIPGSMQTTHLQGADHLQQGGAQGDGVSCGCGGHGHSHQYTQVGRFSYFVFCIIIAGSLKPGLSQFWRNLSSLTVLLTGTGQGKWKGQMKSIPRRWWKSFHTQKVI